MMLEYAEALSLILTWTTFYICVMVCYRWRVQAAIFFSGNREAATWFALGVFTHFSMSLLDNAYWGAAWSAEYSQWVSRDWLFAHGAVTNIPFRQLGTIFAGYCHLRAALKFAGSSPKSTHIGMIAATLIGFAYVALI